MVLRSIDVTWCEFVEIAREWTCVGRQYFFLGSVRRYEKYETQGNYICVSGIHGSTVAIWWSYSRISGIYSVDTVV